MRSPAAQILETALALQRAPGERFRLRERPLPPGMVHVMEIAAGSPQALQAAVAELGEPAPALVEAARFYLEQVLFADDGADAYRVMGLAADASQDAVRTHHRWLQRWLHPDLARAGDASVFATRVNQAFAQLRSPESRHAYDVQLAEARLANASATLAPATVRHWGQGDEAPRGGGRSRWLLAAALVSCVALAVLIVRTPDTSAPWNPDDPDPGAVEAVDPGPAIEDRDLGVLGEALAIAPVQRQPVPEPVDPAPAPAAPQPVTVATARRPLPRAPPQHPPQIIAAVSTVAGAAAAAPIPARPIAEAIPPQDLRPEPGVPPLVAQAPTPPPAPPPAQPAGPRQPTPGVVSAEDAMQAAARRPLAEERVLQLTGYLASWPSAVPLWDSVQALAETNAVRQRINASKGSRLELARPAWRMWPDRATYDVVYRCQSADDAPCGGRLEVTLIWREGLWLVRSVTVGPSA